MPRDKTSDASTSTAGTAMDVGPRAHCYHAERTGNTVGAFPGERRGVEFGRCCQCGRPMLRRWYETSEPIEGHGPHVREARVVWNEPSLAALGHEGEPCTPEPAAP